MSTCTEKHHRGLAVLRDRFRNKSTAFTMEERKQLRIVSLLPAAVETLEEQVARCINQLDHFNEPINKYSFLRNLMEANSVLFYAVVLQDLHKSLPVIYTPTVGEACQNFSHLYALEQGLFIKASDKDRIADCLAEVDGDYDIIVITDGSRILGLGDLGANGMGIPIGKCSLYVAGAGIAPHRVLPMCLDVGTNNEYFLKDPQYVGLKQKRCDDELFYALLDEFMTAAHKRFPKAVVQFEDFSNNHCFDILARYRDQYRCFNDDIQGTGAVIAAGFANALRLSKADPRKQRIVVYGAGGATIGVINAIGDLLKAKYNIPWEDFTRSVYLVDTRGLVTTTRGDKLASHKVALARTDISAEDVAEKYKTLHDVVINTSPTVLIGLAGAGPAFTETMLRHMASYTDRPIILPLSNPTSRSEVTPEDAFKWTDGRAIFASGSPCDPVTLDGRTLCGSQGNNLYVFPGIGLGATIAEVKTITSDLMTRAAITLADMVPEEELENGLYPGLSDIRRISAHIAAGVADEARLKGIANATTLPENSEELVQHMASSMWNAEYGSVL
ncbi:NADP-dependent malic enzyme [Diplonema papillatum]|nr:NADP-dependent malic enzyme [Diplonema papillatum]